MQPFRSLFWLIAGLLGGAGAAAWLLQKDPVVPAPAPRAPLQMATPPVVPVPAGDAKLPTPVLSQARMAPPVVSTADDAHPPLPAQGSGAQPSNAQAAGGQQELEEWKQRAATVQAQLKDVETALIGLRDELTAVQGWQAKTPSLVRLGQSLARLPAHKATAADAAIAAGKFPTVSLDCQDLSIIDGIGETYEQRLYDAGVGTFWELANLSDVELRQIFRLSDWQLRSIDLADIRLQARQLAIDTNSAGLLWEGEAPDDFSRIKGIGKVYEQRLYDAGIRTYRALAAAKAEELGAILGPQVFHPQINQWIVQARTLAQALAKTPADTPAKTPAA